MPSAMMTVRIDPELLAALKAKARSEGRSVSAQVVRLVRAAVEPAPRAGRRRTMGMFSEFAAPTQGELRAGRHVASASLARAVKRRGRA